MARFAQYVIPGAVAGLLVWFFWPRAKTAPQALNPQPLPPQPLPPQPSTPSSVLPLPLPPPPAGTQAFSFTVNTDGANLHAAPTERSGVVRSLEKDLRVVVPNVRDVRPATPLAPQGWVGAITPGTGDEGWVSLAKISDPFPADQPFPATAGYFHSRYAG